MLDIEKIDIVSLGVILIARIIITCVLNTQLTFYPGVM